MYLGKHFLFFHSTFFSHRIRGPNNNFWRNESLHRLLVRETNPGARFPNLHSVESFRSILRLHSCTNNYETRQWCRKSEALEIGGAEFSNLRFWGSYEGQNHLSYGGQVHLVRTRNPISGRSVSRFWARNVSLFSNSHRLHTVTYTHVPSALSHLFTYSPGILRGAILLFMYHKTGRQPVCALEGALSAATALRLGILQNSSVK